MIDMYDIKEFMSIALLVLTILAITIIIYLGITWVEIQIARWMGVDPIWVVGH